MTTAVETPYREHDHVTFHGHDHDAGAPANYHEQPATTSQPSMFPVGGSVASTTSQSIPMTTTTETSSRRPSYDDTAVVKPGLGIVPRTPSDSALIWTNYTLGMLGFLCLLAWLVILLVAQGENFSPALKDSYTVALVPFLEMVPFFFGGMCTVIYSAQRNTAASWFLLTVYNAAAVCFWLTLIVPYSVNLAFPGKIDSSCPDSVGDPLNPFVTSDNTNMCRLRKGAAALSCAVAFVEFLFFVVGLLQTIHHWNFTNPVNQYGHLVNTHPVRKLWIFMIVLEFTGYVIWFAGNLNLVEQSRNRVVTLSDPILVTVTFFLTASAIISLSLTAYSAVQIIPSKAIYGTTLMAHLGAMMGFWAVFVWDARGSNTPSIWLGPAAADVSMNTNKAIAAGIGIMTAMETLFVVAFLGAYCMKWDDRKELNSGDPAYARTSDDRRYVGRV